ncbi:MAG TPA: hypothetical protein VNX68_16310 [Nitrosopumilaceae archaeon]|jgi:hypothetical protein|nr:hypothetical protein [Nitrosopumilaceae archaeon]
MKERILVLDHQVYGLQNTHDPENQGFVSTLYYIPDAQCVECQHLGRFETEYQGWCECLTCIIPHITKTFTNSIKGLKYDNYWTNLYFTAIRKFIDENPEFGLEM